MMTKEEFDRYYEKHSFPGAWMDPFPYSVPGFIYDDMKDALQIDQDYLAIMQDMIIRAGISIDDHTVLFKDHCELYSEHGEYKASSLDDSEIGAALSMVIGAFNAIPRETGLPSHIKKHFESHKEIYAKCPDLDYDDLIKGFEKIGVSWVDEVRNIVHPNQSGNEKADSDKVQPQFNAVLNASDGYIVIDTPVKIFRSQAAMESYRREHKEENTPALFVKDGEILCLQEEVK